MEIGPLLNEWAADGFSDEKLQELKQRHPDVDWLELAGRIMAESQTLKPRFETEIDGLWDRIERKVDGVPEPEEEEEEVEEAVVRPFRRSRRQVFGMVAFFLLLAIILVSINLGGSVEVVEESTGFAETDTIALPGGSTVFLASNSTLKYTPEEWEDDRSVDLTGEAFFEVTSGKGFTVHTSKGNVSVLGTSFNVQSRGKEMTVACKTGKVEVSSPGMKTYLEAGDRVRVKSDGKMETGTVGLSRIGAWTEGSFYYQGEPLKEVFEEVKRQFGIEIEAEEADINAIPCNGYFTNEEIRTAMDQICIPLGLSYEIDESNDKVLVRR